MGSADNIILLYSDKNHKIPATCGYAIGDVLSAGDGNNTVFINNATITGFTGNQVTISSTSGLQYVPLAKRFV